MFMIRALYNIIFDRKSHAITYPGQNISMKMKKKEFTMKNRIWYVIGDLFMLENIYVMYLKNCKK